MIPVTKRVKVPRVNTKMKVFSMFVVGPSHVEHLLLHIEIPIDIPVGRPMAGPVKRNMVLFQRKTKISNPIIEKVIIPIVIPAPM